MRGKAITDEQKALIKDLKREGKTCRAISELTGVSHGAIWKLVSAGNAKTQQATQQAKPVKPVQSVVKSEPVVNSQTKITIIPLATVPANAPICAATTRGIYRGNELNHRGRA
jgi:hypothetical protein